MPEAGIRRRRDTLTGPPGSGVSLSGSVSRVACSIRNCRQRSASNSVGGRLRVASKATRHERRVSVFPAIGLLRQRPGEQPRLVQHERRR